MTNISTQIKEELSLHDRTIVVYYWNKLNEQTTPKVWENVECYSGSGEKLWTVNGMKECKYWDNESDTFVAINNSNGRITLNAFSGNVFELNIENGFVNYISFGK